MMHLLIVDDEKLIVEEIKNSVHWDELSIDRVFTAMSMHQAIQIFQEDEINIMVCDIEMPQGNGLELLEWVRANSPGTEAIFLTCHAEFKYAKKAIQMGSLEYLLKPISYEALRAALAKAVKKVSEDHTLSSNSRYGQFWSKHQPLLIEHFWIDILNHDIPAFKEDIRKAAADRNIPFDANIRLVPVLICVHKWNEELSLKDERLMEFSVKNIAQELITDLGSRGQIIHLQNNVLLAVLSDEQHSNDINQLKSNCEEFIKACNKHLKCDLSCYIGEKAEAQEMAATVEELYRARKNNVAYVNKVFLYGQSQSTEQSALPDIDTLFLIMSKGSRQAVMAEISAFLNVFENARGLDLNRLVKFQQNFLQAMYTFLKQKGIKAEEFISNNTDIDLYTQSNRSLDDMKKWILSCSTKANDYLNSIEDSVTVIEKVKDYITAHIDTELNRNDIAGYVYLSPDYLTKVFRKETGLSLSQYIIQERMKVAKHLLTVSQVPIRDVAMHVGCENLSYFSKLFRKCEKMSPYEYRQNHRSLNHPTQSGVTQKN